MRCKYGGIEVARRNNGERRRKKERGTVLNIENFQGEEFFFEKFFFRQSLKISSYLEELANFFLFLSFLIIILLSLSKTWFVQREREKKSLSSFVYPLRRTSSLPFYYFRSQTSEKKRENGRGRGGGEGAHADCPESLQKLKVQPEIK